MTKETMTVHKILAELKVLDDRIQTAIYNGQYIKANKHSNDKIEGSPVSDYKKKMQSNYQKVDDLIKRRNAMKRALVLSNATTKLNVCGTEYTVAEAIDMKNHGMDNYKMLLKIITDQYNHAKCELENNSGEALEKKAESFILATIQAQPRDNKMSVDSSEMQKLREGYIRNNTYDLLDPNNILKIIDELNNKITDFETEIDAALSVSNALTVVEFEY